MESKTDLAQSFRPCREGVESIILTYLKKQAKTNIKKYIDERLPEVYEKCMVGLTAILREAWTTAK